MTYEGWILLVGILLLLLGSAGWLVRKIPILTPTMLYLGVGAILGPWGWGVIHLDPFQQPMWLHRGAELAVIVSLFTVGLKIRLSLRDSRWLAPLILATVSMLLTIGLTAALGAIWLGLPLGAAVLLGAVLAPTDPVLASEVQLRHAKDADEFRLTLSAEAGLNDGTAFPFVMLGLGLLGLHELGEHGARWWSVDLLWAVVGGLAIGGALGLLVGRVLLHLGSEGRAGTGAAVYLVGGTIGVSYATALSAHAYGFLAVFASAVALRWVERRETGKGPEEPALEAPSPELREGTPMERPKAAVNFAEALLSLSEYAERLLEIGVAMLVGAILATVELRWSDVAFAVGLFVVIRPLSVLPICGLKRFSKTEWGGFAWFGIRGIGSIYYLFYAVEHGLPDELARRLVAVTLTVVALSVVVHGLSAPPLLRRLRPNE